MLRAGVSLPQNLPGSDLLRLHQIRVCSAQELDALKQFFPGALLKGHTLPAGDYAPAFHASPSTARTSAVKSQVWPRVQVAT